MSLSKQVWISIGLMAGGGVLSALLAYLGLQPLVAIGILPFAAGLGWCGFGIRCPHCGGSLARNFFRPYCPHCGKELDWS